MQAVYITENRYVPMENDLKCNEKEGKSNNVKIYFTIVEKNPGYNLHGFSIAEFREKTWKNPKREMQPLCSRIPTFRYCSRTMTIVILNL
jgi:hypothetical protein